MTRDWMNEGGIPGEVQCAPSHQVQQLTRTGWHLVAITEEDTVDFPKDQRGNVMLAQNETAPPVLRRPVFVLARSKEKSIAEATALTEAEIKLALEKLDAVNDKLHEEQLHKEKAEKELAAAKREIERMRTSQEGQLKAINEGAERRYNAHTAVLLKALTDQPDEERSALEALARLGNVEQIVEWLKARAETRAATAALEVTNG